jgi:mono/diheme cytochrome c family protein
MRVVSMIAVLALLVGGAQVALAADVEAGETKFRQLCFSCHGNTGRGDGPAAAGLRPKPADMTSAQWQSSVADDYLRDIITRGGAAVGKSPMMTPWGHALKGDDLDNVIAYIRSLDD